MKLTVILKRISLLLCLLLSGLVGLVGSVPETAVAQSAKDRRFGAVEAFWAPNEAAELGVGWERILFYWNEIQPTGPNDWNTLHVPEEWLNEANAQGRQVVGLLKNTPNWATEGEFAAGVPNGLYLPVDDPGNLWANYVRRVSSYYGARGVNNWIVWNEPDIAPEVYGHEFSGSMEDYYQLLKVAYTVIKQTNPSATVHLGGMTYWHDPSYLGRFLRMVAADPDAAANNYYFDVISLHIYFRPETVSTIVGNAFAAQQQAGIQPFKAVWINETNARPSMDPEWPVQVQAFDIDLDQQAWYIPQAYALGFYAGAGRIAIYKLVDVNLEPGGESWGLVRPNDFSRRPAYFAYKTTIDYLAGFEYPIRREMSGNHYLFTFNRPQGVTRLMWARNQSAVTLRLPALAESALLVQTTGEATPITPVNGVYEITLEGARCYGECLMGGPPLFLVEEGVRAEGGTSAQPPVVNPAPTAVSADSDDEATVEPTVAATVAVTETVAPTVTLTSEPTSTPTVRPTRTPTATAVPPTATAEPTAAPTDIPATEVAALPPTAAPTLAAPAADSAALDEATGNRASFFLLGTAVLLAILLAVGWRVRNR